MLHFCLDGDREYFVLMIDLKTDWSGPESLQVCRTDRNVRLKKKEIKPTENRQEKKYGLQIGCDNKLD